MSLVFHDVGHTYELDGQRVPSVTGILKASGLIDFSSIPPSILGDALARGTTVHQAIHFYNERDLDVREFNGAFPQYANYLAAWIAFCRERRFVAVLNEHRVASRRYQVAGTIDCLGTLDGAGVLVDFKTGHPKDVAADLQTAAYYGLALEWAEEDADVKAFFSKYRMVQRYAIRLKRDGTFQVEPYTAWTDYRDFLALVTARQIVANRKRITVDWTEAA